MSLNQLLILATWQTIYMVGVSSIIGMLFGIPLGIILAITHKNGICEQRILHQVLAIIINATRSIPFIILLVAITPLTRLLTGTSIGTLAAIVPLSVGAIPFIARIIETAIYEVPRGLHETGMALGANHWQVIRYFLLPEALPAIIDGMTVVIVALIGYSAMAGAIGGGGLGEVAINYGYQRFNMKIMLITIIILIMLVQLIQFLGERWANHLRHKISH
ncbi:MAG: ABC transporter permease [Legionellales bacterium]|nr:ABC transporter permease [Legionellales bacterium]